MAEQKTNAMRALDGAGIAYAVHSYKNETVGSEVARLLGLDPARVFKTLVTAAKSGKHYVFMIPVERELDFKKAASAAGEKSIEMIMQKELFPLTGYVHGGCSPIGMKKQFDTFIDETAFSFDTIFFSAGKIGLQIETPASALASVIKFKTASATRQKA